MGFKTRDIFCGCLFLAATLCLFIIKGAHSSDDTGIPKPAVYLKRAPSFEQHVRAGEGTSRNARRHIDSSDEDASIDEEFSSEEEEEAASSGSDEHLPTPRSSTKRKKKTSGRASAKKTKGDLYYPQLSKWPPVVDMKDITKVSKKIVALNKNSIY